MDTTTTTRNGIGPMVAGMVMLLAAAVAAQADPSNPATPAAPAVEALPSGQDLLTMEQSLRGPDAASQAGRKQLAALIERRHLAGVAATRSVSPGEWKILVAELSKDLTPSSRQAWRAGIRAAFAASPTDLQALGAGDVMAIVSTCSLLGDAQVGTLLDQLDPMWSAGKVDWGTCVDAAKVWHGRDASKTQTWALRACKGMVIDKQDQMEFSHMSDMASLFGQLEVQGSFSEFVMMLTTAARAGKTDAGPWEHCADTSAALGRLTHSPECLQMVTAELLNPKGFPRQGIAEVLTWAHRASGTSAEWTQYVDGKIAATKGDAKAYWLLTRAYVESVAVSGATDPFAGEIYLNQAMAAAESLETRLYVVGYIAFEYSYCVQRRRGEAFLDSVASQFTGAEALAQFTKLREDFGRKIAEDEAWLAARNATEAAGLRGLQVRHLLACLAKAKAKGDTAGVARFETLLSQGK